MNKKKVKKNKVIKRIKKVTLMIVEEIKKVFSKIYRNFMSLPQKVRLIIYVWGIVLFIILFLIIGSSRNSVFLEKYSDIEKSMNAAALDYVDSNKLYPVKDNKLVLNLEILKDYNFIYEEDITDKTCDGFSLIYYDDIEKKYEIDSFIDCEDYTTKGYYDYKK